MTNIVLLNNVDHHDLRVAAGEGATAGDAVNQLLVFPTEWEAVQREYPIFFRRDEAGAFQSVALLGLDRDENLFLGDHGWDARHVPAIQRRGPFSIGLHDDGSGREPEPMIHIDLDHPGVGAADGQPVFLPQGGNSPYLEAVAELLRQIHTGIALTAPMFAAFEAEGLIQPVQVEINLSEFERYTLPDLHAIDAQALAALGADALARLHAAGFLTLAFHAVSSLGNVSQLIERKNRRRLAR